MYRRSLGLLNKCLRWRGLVLCERALQIFVLDHAANPVTRIHQGSAKPPTIRSLSPICHQLTTPYGKGATTMSESSTATADTPHVVQNVNHTPQEEVVVESAPLRAEAQLPPAPIFITEHEVVFSTAAATALRPTRRWIEAVRIVAVAMRRIFVSARADSRPKRRHYPARASYLEDSRMEREMYRL
jgi:hypothetical protein